MGGAAEGQAGQGDRGQEGHLHGQVQQGEPEGDLDIQERRKWNCLQFNIYILIQFKHVSTFGKQY